MTGNDNQTPSRLSDAALSDLGLSVQPFEDDRNRDHMNDSNSQSIRSEIEQQLKHGELLHLLVGPSGSGKSVLLSQLVRHNKDYLKPYIARGDANFEARGFLAAVLGQFDGEQADSIDEHVEGLLPHFDKLNSNQTTPALIIDNAHLAPIEEISELIGLMPSLQLDGKPLARLLLTGVAAFQDELDAIGEEFEMLPYSVSAMPALTADRTREYLSFRFNQAGFVGEFPFTDNAITRIHQNADGIPAAINHHAATYLNKVYTGTGVAAATGVEGGLIGALGWPVIGLGAAALALIVWGLSMFGAGGSSPDNTLATVDDNNALTPVASSSPALTATPAAGSAGVATGNDDLLRPEHRDVTDSDSPAQSSTEQTPSTGTIADGSTAQTTGLLQSEEPSDGSVATGDAGTAASNDADTDLQAQAQPVPAAPAATDTEVASESDTTNTTGDVVANASSTLADSTTASTETAIAAPEATVADTAPVTPPASTSAAAESSIVPVPAQVDDTDAASVPVVSDGTSDDGVPVPVTQPEPQPVPEPEEPRVLRAVENERWVLFQPNTKFTLQLATSRERGYIMEFAQTLPLDGPLAVYPFVIKSNGRQVYGLLNGIFDTTDEALAAIDAMPAEVRKFKPWIRPIKQLQDEIKNGQ